MQRLIALLPIAALACGSTTTPVASKYVVSQLVSAQSGGTLAVTQADDPMLAGTTLSVPPGALAKDTTLTIAEGGAVTPSGDQEAGPVADFGPSGTTFLKAVTITLPYQLPSGATIDQLAVEGVEADGSQLAVAHSALAIDSSMQTLSFEANGFTRFGAIALPPACPAHEILCNGSCIPAGLACAADGGVGGGTIDGGTGCVTCPQGQFWCGCTSAGGSCMADNQACPLACPQGQGSVPACTPCPPGDVLCNGQCEPDTLACPAPLDGGTSGGDAGSPGPIDGGTGCSSCPSGEYWCGCSTTSGSCVSTTQACPLMCPVGAATCAPTCGFGEVVCNGQCVPSGQPCSVGSNDGGIGAGTSDAGSCVVCPTGYTWCGCDASNGQCLPSSQQCLLMCASPPPC